MANKLSSKKSIRKTKTRTLVNKSRLSRVKTFVKKFESLVSSEEVGATITQEAFVSVQSELSRAAQKGAIKKNTAARKISRLAKKLKLSSGFIAI
ncbi:MAG: 30S ribosomal protein S20 [Rickettsiaceae bacterium]|nr:30S ribosomal protein S20 [Rickettsiaceae bacterium]